MKAPGFKIGAIVITLIIAIFVACSLNKPTEQNTESNSVQNIPFIENTFNSESNNQDTTGLPVICSWSTMSRTQRIAAVLARAGQDDGHHTGYNCKAWVSQVFRDASGGVVIVPRTLPDASGYYWDYSPYFYGVSGGIRSTSPGCTVQMRWRLNNGTITPHTMIITGRQSNGIWVIDCNWCGAGDVCNRWIPYSEFDSHVVAYSCNYIN